MPEERPRYTSLGGIVVSTALIAGTSVLGALTLMTDVSPWLLLPIAGGWGLIIANVDRFLITSLHGDQAGWLRLGNVLIRLALAIVIGVFIAEPLTLKIFQERLDRQIQIERDDRIRIAESQFKLCNPSDGKVPAGVDCTRHLLNGGDQAFAVKEELASRETQLKTAETKLVKDMGTHQKLSGRVDRECLGVKAAGTSGVAGNGPRCMVYTNDLETFLAGHDLKAQQTEVSRMKEVVGGLRTRLTNLEENRESALSRRMEEHRNSQTEAYAAIGILDRWEALGTVAAQNGMVNFAHWLLRLIFVLLDCMPIISKVLNGRTEYDRVLAAQLRSGSARHLANLKAGDREIETRLYEEECRLRAERARIDRDHRINQVSRDEEIDRLAQKFMNERPDAP
ncbi:hypothetical protein Hesp01_31660 [Herbidospora sp. NBRC 101105]|nr:hypothetical protein Hesp01_31660 [Herbidospora sp. NBRC 101105]